jgi:hypothetical protein
VVNIAETVSGLDSLTTDVEFNAAIEELARGTATARSTVAFGALIQELAIAADSPLARFLWELINDSQSVAWQNIGSSSPTVWQTINDFEDPDWTPVDTSLS